MSDRFAHYPSLVDKVVFVTGGGSGIGASVVEHFCAQQAKVAFVDIDDAASTALCRRMEEAGLRAPRYFHCDLRDVAALQAIIRRVGDETGPVTVAGQQRGERRPAQGDRTSRSTTGTTASPSTCATSSSPRRPPTRR